MLFHSDLNPIGYSRITARLLGPKKGNIKWLLAGTNLNKDDFLNKNQLIHEADQFQIYKNALNISSDPSFGLRLGKLLTPSTHGPMGFLANCSPTLLSALNNYSNHLPSRFSCGAMKVDVGEQWTECILSVHTALDPYVYRYSVESFSLSVFLLAEYILGMPLSDASLELNYDQPDYSHQYSNYIPCPIRFGAAQNKIIIPTSLLNITNASFDYDVYQLALNRCDEVFNTLEKKQDDTKEQVKKLLLANPSNQLTEEQIATQIFMSKRTLARHLATEGTNFRKLRDEVFTSLAENYLSNTTLSIENIANLLGYHDSSSFRRSFKRLYKTTPQNFRTSK